MEPAIENNVRVVAPVAEKKFTGLIAFSLNREEYAAAVKYFCSLPGEKVQLQIKKLIVETLKENKLLNDNKVEGGVCVGE